MVEAEVETIITISNLTTTNHPILVVVVGMEEEEEVTINSRTINKTNINLSREIISTVNSRTIIVVVVAVEFRADGPKEERLTKIIVHLNRIVVVAEVTATIVDIPIRMVTTAIIVIKIVGVPMITAVAKATIIVEEEVVIKVDDLAIIEEVVVVVAAEDDIKYLNLFKNNSDF